jgi:ABC-type transporter Mla MlaB component
LAESVGQWADMVNPMPKYVGSNTLSGDLEWNATLLARETSMCWATRGTVRMELDDVKRFDSGVVLLTYLPAS